MKHITAMMLCGLLLVDAATAQGLADAPAAPPSLKELVRRTRAARLVDYDGWKVYRRDQSVFTFEKILTIFANQRRVQGQIRIREVAQEELDRWRDFMADAALEAEVVNLAADAVELKRAYNKLYARLERLVEESRGGGAGILGTIGAVVLSVAFSGAELPVLGAAVAGGFATAADGGSIPEIIISMGMAAGSMSASIELSGAVATAATEVGEQASRALAEAAGGLVDVVADATGEAVNAVVRGQPTPYPLGDRRAPLGNAMAPGGDDHDVPARAREVSLELAGSVLNPIMLMRPLVWTSPEHVDAPMGRPEPSSVNPGPPTLASLARSERLRRVADPGEPVLTGLLLIAIDAEARASRAQVRYMEILQNLHRKWERNLEYMRLEAEANHFWGERQRWHTAYKPTRGSLQPDGRQIAAVGRWPLRSSCEPGRRGHRDGVGRSVCRCGACRGPQICTTGGLHQRCLVRSRIYSRCRVRV